jgi:leucine dehydrogenase
LGATLNSATISELGAPVVCGGANNQLAASQHGRDFLMRGVTNVPDCVANAGGIINVIAEYYGEPAESVHAGVLAIVGRVARILAQSRAEQRPANEVSDELARVLIGRPPFGTHLGVEPTTMRLAAMLSRYLTDEKMVLAISSDT